MFFREILEKFIDIGKGEKCPEKNWKRNKARKSRINAIVKMPKPKMILFLEIKVILKW